MYFKITEQQGRLELPFVPCFPAGALLRGKGKLKVKSGIKIQSKAADLFATSKKSPKKTLNLERKKKKINKCNNVHNNAAKHSGHSR